MENSLINILNDESEGKYSQTIKTGSFPENVS